jgi:1-acyl-sn-glycerol-3-phosphate acyltransferase
LIRAAIRILLLAIWCLLGVPFAVGCVVATLGRRSARMRLGAFLNRYFSRGICGILGIRLRRVGDLPPPGGCLVTPNHWGYVDVFVLAALHRTSFVSRADVAGWPVVGAFARAGGTLFIRREVRRDTANVGGEIARHLRAGGSVTVFLEGGAGAGTEVRKFRSSLVAGAVAAGAPCVPVALHYTLPEDPDLDPSDAVAWTQGDFLPHARRLLRLRRIDAEVTFLPPRTGTDRKRLARELEDDVRAVVEKR